MAVEAPISKYKINNLKIFIAVLSVLAIWFAYDGYFNENFRQKHTAEDGLPDSTMVFNQKAPPILAGVVVLLGLNLLLIKGKKVVAGDTELVACKRTIAYDSIEKIDKTHFDSKGYFVITYKDKQGKESQLKLGDRTYDNLPAVLDEIVAKIS